MPTVTHPAALIAAKNTTRMVHPGNPVPVIVPDANVPTMQARGWVDESTPARNTKKTATTEQAGD